MKGDIFMPREVAMYANKNGELKTLTEWAKEFGISRDTMYHRVVQILSLVKHILFMSGHQSLIFHTIHFAVELNLDIRMKKYFIPKAMKFIR